MKTTYETQQQNCRRNHNIEGIRKMMSIANFVWNWPEHLELLKHQLTP